jgi:hypothetical protein
MTYEVYGEVRHSGNDCPETHEDAAYINNGFRQQNNNGRNNQSHPQGGNSNFNSNFNSNQPSLKDLVLGQAMINENLTKKLMFNDEVLENINSKNRRSNKMIETQLAQIAAAILVENNGKVSGQPENSFEKVTAVTMRGGIQS